MAPNPDGSGVTPTLSADDLVAAVPQLRLATYRPGA